MPQFTDLEGREWPLVVKVKTAQECRDALDFDIFADDAMEKLQGDPLKLLRVLWTLCKAEANERSVRADKFEDAVIGDPLQDAFFALIEATANFCGGLRKKALLLALKKTKEQLLKAESELEKAIETALSGGSSTTSSESPE